MERTNRDARRATAMSASINPSLSNALPRRRHRTSLRDSLEEDVPLELPDTSRSGLRDRHVGGKKDRERSDRVDRDRERLLRNKRRRGDGNGNRHRLIHHGGTGNRGEELGMVADESSDESVNDNEDEDDYEHLHHQQHARLLQPASAATPSASMMLNSSRRSYPPSSSAMAAAAGAALKVRPAWKAADEMIGVSVPRKARSASAKRSHDCWVGGGTNVSHASGDQAARQSPARPSPVAASPVNNRPASPSSSNTSAHKKLKLNGLKQRPLSKPVSKPVSSSATQDEIEIAEVLYGMMRQQQGPSPKSESSFGGESVKTEVWQDENKKPMPVSNSGSVLPLQNSSSSIPLSSAIAPKRKKPRAVKYDEEIQVQSTYPSRNNGMAAKIEVDSTMKIDSSPSMERGRGSGMVVNGGKYEPGKPQDEPEDASKMEGLPGLNKRDEPEDSKQELHSLKKESEGKTEPQRSARPPEAENQLEEKFQIDLMAPPPTRSSPGRDGHDYSPAGAVQISNGTAVEEGEKRRTEAKKNKEGGVINSGKEMEVVRREAEGDGKKSAGGGGDSKGRMVDLQIDLESGGGMMKMGNGSDGGVVSKRNHPPFPKQQQQPAADKSAPPAGPLTFPIPVAGWSGGLPPMGYIPPLPGVVSVDGSAVTNATLQPPPLLFSQPAKRCATHCYIARNISYHQQMARIPFWPTAAASAAGPMSLYGAKPCNVNVMASADPNGNVSTRSVNAVAEKGQNLGFPGHSGKDKGPQTSSESQRKPVLLQQSIPPGAPSNILHGPAFIFPLSQQYAAATANSVRSGSSNSPNISNTAATPGAAAASVASSPVAPTGAAAAMSFSYPNMPVSETEYLAILQNNSFPFPVPTLMGAAPAYRGTHPQAMPFFNGPFFSSQMLHPSQLPQQVPSNLTQLQGQGHQNSSGYHLQNQQKPPGTVSNGSSGSLQGFASGKIQPSPQTLMQQPQIDLQQPQQVRPSESEFAGGDSLLTPDARIPRTNMTTIYGQNFAVPIHAPNFALMSQAPQGRATGANSNNSGEKKQQPQLNSQHQGSKQYAVDSLQSQAFALSFGNMGNSASAHALDISSIAQGHTVLQSLPEATSHTYQMMAAAVASQNTPQKKNIRATDDGCKGRGNDASNDYDRKPVAGKSLTTGGQSITFTRPDMMDTSVSSLTGSSVVDSSVRALNLGSSSSRASVSVMPAQATSINPGSPSPQQVQRSQQQHMIQLHKQHQFAAAAAAAARSKTSTSSNGSSVYSENLGASASAAAKYTSSLSTFPQNFVQGSGSPAQSPQWRGSTRPAISPMTSPTSQSLKHLSQQPVQRVVPPGQTHISFANSNSKSSNPSQGQQIAVSSQQSPSSPAVVGSPTTSSVSKSTGGSPRTTTSSTGNKPIQGASSLQAQHAKSSMQSMPMHKSSPVGSGNVPSILGNSPLTASTGAGAKLQLPQQQQLSKQNLQQAQLFFSHPYVPVPAGHSSMTSTSTASATNAYYMQRHPFEQQPKAQHLSQGSGPSSTTAMLSLCPPTTISSPVSCDPVKAVAVGNSKGSNLQAQGILHAAPFTVTQSSSGSHQIVQAGLSYIHAAPNAVKVKQAEQKPPAGE